MLKTPLFISEIFTRTRCLPSSLSVLGKAQLVAPVGITRGPEAIDVNSFVSRRSSHRNGDN